MYIQVHTHTYIYIHSCPKVKDKHIFADISRNTEPRLMKILQPPNKRCDFGFSIKIYPPVILCKLRQLIMRRYFKHNSVKPNFAVVFTGLRLLFPRIAQRRREHL